MKRIAKILGLNIHGLSDETAEQCIIETINKHMKNNINRIYQMRTEKDRNTMYTGLYTITTEIKIADMLYYYCNKVDIMTLESDVRLNGYIEYYKSSITKEFIDKYNILINKEERDAIYNYIKDSVNKLLSR